MANLFLACSPDNMPTPPDMTCEISVAELIGNIHYTLPGYPIVLPVATTAEAAMTDTKQRDAARLMRALVTRWASTGPDKIYTIGIYSGVMPFGTPAYRLNPQTGTQHLDQKKTDMRVEFTDYRANLELYEFWKKMGDGTQRLFFFENDGILVGGLKGIKASVTSTAGIIDGQEVSNQMKMAVVWRGHPMPDKTYLAA